MHGFRFDVLTVESTKIGVFESDACSLEVNVSFERSAVPLFRG
jgi:hypothetical protein